MHGAFVFTDAQLNAWLTFFGGIIVAGLGLIAALANRTRQHAKASREQVENNHESNLREEQDERHIESMAAFSAGRAESMAAIGELRRHIDARFEGQSADIRGLRKDIGRLADADGDLEDRIRDLEITQPRPHLKEE